MSTVLPGIHPHAKDAIDQRHTISSKRIINFIKQEFFITNGGGDFGDGGSTYYYIVVKPTQRFVDSFGLEKEMIVLFSEYPRFEARTLDVFRKICNRFDRTRIEQFCYILFSMEPDIENKLNSYLSQNKESQIVIGTNYKDYESFMLRSNYIESFFYNKFRASFLLKDLYDLSAPLTDETHFFGRTDLIFSLKARFSNGENYGLFGLRRTGKTSVINGLRSSLKADNIESVIIDCGSSAFNHKRWNQALNYIVDQVAKQCGYNFSPSFAKQFLFTESDCVEGFEYAINNIIKHSSSKKLVLMFDEIENITFNVSPSPNWGMGQDFIFFWQALRSYFQRYPNRFNFLIVGTNSSCLEQSLIGKHDNPLFGSVSYDYIKGFTVRQTEDMVKTLGKYSGIIFSEDTYSILNTSFGGHPFLIRQYCSFVFKIRQNDFHHLPTFEVSRSIFEKTINDFQQNHTNYVELILNVLKSYYSDEYYMLERLALGDSDTFNFFATESPYFTKHLLDYGIIYKDSFGEYDFNMQIVKNYLKEKRKYSALNLTKEDILLEINERRVALEKKLRLKIKDVLQIMYGEAEAKDIVLSVFGSKRKIEYDIIPYADLFDAKNRDVSFYFKDIEKIIVSRWDSFKNVLRSISKSEFEESMQTVNTHRDIDAHSKEIQIEDFYELRKAFTRIENSIG